MFTRTFYKLLAKISIEIKAHKVRRDNSINSLNKAAATHCGTSNNSIHGGETRHGRHNNGRHNLLCPKFHYTSEGGKSFTVSTIKLALKNFYIQSYKVTVTVGNVCIRARWPIRPALNSGFCSMKRLGILLLPPGWDASPSQGYPQHYDRRYPFIHLGKERQREAKFLV